jgi:hypothetical protein
MITLMTTNDNLRTSKIQKQDTSPCLPCSFSTEFLATSKYCNNILAQLRLRRRRAVKESFPLFCSPFSFEMLSFLIDIGSQLSYISISSRKPINRPKQNGKSDKHLVKVKLTMKRILKFDFSMTSFILFFLFLFSLRICYAHPTTKISGGYSRYVPFSEFSFNKSDGGISYLGYHCNTYSGNGIHMSFAYNIYRRFWPTLEAMYWLQKLDVFDRRAHIASYRLVNIPISFNFRIDHIFSKSIPPSGLNLYLNIGTGMIYQRFSPEVFYPPPDQYDYENLSGFIGEFHLGVGLERRIKGPIYLNLGARIFFAQKKPASVDESSSQNGNINIDGIILKITIGMSH